LSIVAFGASNALAMQAQARFIQSTLVLKWR
jgi:hypothetical protein